MLFISMDDFWDQVRAIPRLSREAEKALAMQMAAGDPDAREALIRSYLYMVAAAVRKAPRDIQTLHTVYVCTASLEQGVDKFNFQQDGEPFQHHLSWRMRQCITRCIAGRA